MVNSTNYFYSSQVRTLLLHTLRIFSNFNISTGINQNGENILKKVPVILGSSDRSVLTMINNNTDNIIETVPKMILAITNFTPNEKERFGTPFEEEDVSFTEKVWDGENENYVYEPGNSYSIKRFSPSPIKLTLKLYILTSLLNDKLQLWEQIRTIFTPTLELQTSENPLDWTRLQHLTLTDMNWGSRGTGDFSSTQLDVSDMTFEIKTNLDVPAIVSYENIIENIMLEIGAGNNVPDLLGWDSQDVTYLNYTPTNTKITVSSNDTITLHPNDKAKTWRNLLKVYGINENGNIKITVTPYIQALENKLFIEGTLTPKNLLNSWDDTDATWTIDSTTLPTETPNISPIIDIINPHNISLEELVDGGKYLVLDNIKSNTELWGTLFKSNIEIETINKNSIIQYDKTNTSTNVLLDPEADVHQAYYIKHNDFIYNYDYDYKNWFDVINRKYQTNMWKISFKNI